MSDSHWCRAEVARVEDLRRGYDLTARDFGRHAADLWGLWPDRAGRDFQDRYLDPMLGGLAAVGDRTAGQLAELAGVATETAAVESLEAALAALSDEVSRTAAAAGDRAAKSTRHTDASLNSASASAARATEAEAILAGL